MLNIIEHIKSINKISLIFSILMMTRAIGFLPFNIPSVLEHGGVICMALFCFHKHTHIEKIWLLLIVYLIINIVFSDINPIFNPWGRFVYFVTILLCVSPMLQSEYLRKIRQYIFIITIKMGIILSVITFFCWFLGINFMKYENLDITKAGLFSGLFNHSMVMGPIAGLSAIYLVHMFIKKNNWLYMLLALTCIGALLLSASRTAFICVAVSLIFLILKNQSNNIKTIKNISIIILGLTISFPLWRNVTDLLVEKQNNNLATGSTFSSRESVWNTRIDEFKSCPSFGIGFCSIDTSKNIISESGTIEPGSSWLAVLSMTGIIGFIIVFTIIIRSFICCAKTNEDNSLLLSLLIFFLIHMITEGYIFSGGSFLCFLVWLIIGCCYDKKYEAEETIDITME